MRDAEQSFTVFEEYEYKVPAPEKVYFGRYLGGSSRHAIIDYSLKTRDYINTTSMDSELALLTANLTLAAPNKVFYDPFVGTGSFPIACSHFGARTMGSDIDGRMLRGKNGKDIKTNFRQYGLLDRYLDGFVSDLTHSPLRRGRWLDGIIGDPPYGVREGPKVLGTKDGSGKEVVYINGEASHLYGSSLRILLLLTLADKTNISPQRNLTASKQCWKIYLNLLPSCWSMTVDCLYGCRLQMMKMFYWVFQHTHV